MRLETPDFEDEDSQIRLFQRTRNANALTWIALNLGSNPSPHAVEVVAQLDAELTGLGMAKAAVGKRTLVGEPARLANDATV